MLTGVVPSQDRYSRSPLSDGLVRSNFWKGRQRLNRLYRWIANVVRPKIDWSILCDARPQNNPEVHDFLICRDSRKTAHRGDLVLRGFEAVTACLPAAELTARRRTTRRSATGTFVLVAENEAAFLQVIGRHLDRHPVARQRLDPVLLHLAGGVGDDFVPGIELHAITCIGEDLGHQSFELDQLFFSHGYLQVDRQLSLWPLGTVGSGIRPAFAMQKGNSLHPLGLAVAVRWTGRLVPIGLMPIGLLNAIITTGTAVTARPFRARCGIMTPGGVHARSGPRASVLRRRRRRVAMTRRAAVFTGQCDADQLFDVAQIRDLLAGAERDCHTVRAGARGAADTVDIGLGYVGQIEIHHMADAVDIDAAGGDVGCDQGADLAGAECRQHPLAMILRLVAMNGVGGDAGPRKAFHDLVRAMLGAGKDQRAIDRLLLQELSQ